MSLDRSPGQRFFAEPPAAGPEAGEQAGVRPYVTGPDPNSTPPTQLDTYHRSRWVPIVIGVVVVALLAALVWIGTRPDPSASPSTPAASAQPSSASTFTPPPGGQGIEFNSTDYGAKGWWEISNVEWDSDGVTITSRIYVSEGSLRFTFLALDNVTANQFSATEASTLGDGTIDAGESKTGTIRFNKNHEATTVILAYYTGRQITALVIDA